MPHTSERTDVTDWVIHFVRDRDPTNDMPDEVYEGKLQDEEEPLAPDERALGVLLHVLDTGGIRPWYSFRGGKTTIYGGQPAVCFTEMPVYNFAKYTQERADSKRLTAYGVCVRKKELYKAGGRPVIYGLTGNADLVEDTAMRRILNPSVLPVAEQFRYVAYNPARPGYPLDWTHEREWRWMATDADRHEVPLPNGLGYAGWKPALPLFRGRRGEHGPCGYFTEVGILVWTPEEADRIVHTLTNFADAGSNMYGEIFDRTVIERSFVIVLSEVVEAVEKGGDYRAQRIEEVPSSAVRRIARAIPDASDYERVEAAVAEAKRSARDAAIDMLGGPDQIDRPMLGYCGWASVITYEGASAVTRAMLEREYAQSIGGQYYRIDVLGDVPLKQSLDYNEQAAQAAADSLTEALSQKFWVHSIAD